MAFGLPDLGTMLKGTMLKSRTSQIENSLASEWVVDGGLPGILGCAKKGWQNVRFQASLWPLCK